MTRSQLMAIVTALCSSSGRPFVDGAVDQNTVCNRRLKMFTERTHCLYDDAIAFTLNPSGVIPSNGIYDLRSNAFTREICDVDQVVIDGETLQSPHGQYGLTSIADLTRFHPHYRNDPAGRPTRASQTGLASLRLYPVPDHAYSNCFVSGAYLHPDVDTSTAGDDVDLDIPDEYGEVAAAYVAIGLIIWNSTTESDYERMSFFSRASADQMKELEEKTQELRHTQSIRGGRSRTRTVTFG